MHYTFFHRQLDEQRQKITEATKKWQIVHAQLEKLEKEIKLPDGTSSFNPVYKAKRAEAIPRLEAILAKIRKYLDEQNSLERGVMDSLERDRKLKRDLWLAGELIFDDADYLETILLPTLRAEAAVTASESLSAFNWGAFFLDS